MTSKPPRPNKEVVDFGEWLAADDDNRWRILQFLAFNYRCHGREWLDERIEELRANLKDVPEERRKVTDDWLATVQEEAMKSFLRRRPN